MTLSVRSRPQRPGALTTVLSRSSARPRPRLATWWRGIVSRRGQTAALRAQLGFEPRERLLGLSAGPAGGYAVAASDRALYQCGNGEGWSRRGWEQIEEVGWEPAGGRLIITSIDGGAHTRAVVPLRERGHLPEIALERITHTRLGSWRIALPGGRSVAVAARRRPVSDEVLWFVLPARDSLGPNGSDQRVLVERAIGRLAAELGLARLPAGDLGVIGLPR